jgi:hypothetical protein
MTSGADANVLLQGLAVFLGETVRPAIADKGLAFRVRIAQHMAMSLAFEQQFAEGHDRAALQRLSVLLLEDVTVTTATQARELRAVLEAKLAQAIRDGTITPDAARPHIEQSLRDELSFTNPAFDLRKDLP